jgi:2',3'-cyclic-nucleotide 2'-phosphodiesterase (5'-nucleotidase family)
VTLDGAAAALLPDDDGAQLAIFYGSELLGSLDGCGCMGNPRLGGLPYRFAFTEGFRAARPEIGTLQVDAGASMASVTNVEGREVADFVARDEGVVTALDRLGFDAVNVTPRDISFLSRYFREDAWERAVGQRPALARFVSANLEPTRGGLVAPPPYVVRTVSAPRVAGGSVRVAIAGVTQPEAKNEPLEGFRVTPPLDALARALPRARELSDFVVVLAYMPARQAADLAASLGPLADLVVVANSLSGDAAPVLDRAPRVVYSWYKTQNLGVVRMTLDGTAVRSAAASYVKLDDPLPRDPLAEELAAAAEATVRSAKERRFAEQTGGGTPQPSGAP